MKALIFGITGQDGFYLRKLLTENGVAVIGAARSGGDVQLDVSDRRSVENLIRETQPDYVFHLAAESSTAHQYLWENHHAIADGTIAILDAVDRHHRDCRVLLAGSGLQLKNDSLPIDENAAVDYSSPYAVCRNYSLNFGRYFRQRGLSVYFAYLFNHDSPLRTSRHLNMKIAQAAAAAAAGSSEKLHIGDPAAEKEFNFAGDIVSALWKLIRQDEVTEAVAGSGLAYPISRWLQLCYEYVGLNWTDWVVSAPDYRSPYRRLVSNPARLKSLGWHPEIGIEELAAMMMNQAISRQSADS